MVNLSEIEINSTSYDFVDKDAQSKITEMEAKIPKDVSRSASDITFVGNGNKALFYLRQATNNLAGALTAADKRKLDATTLAGKGITDAYTKAEVDAKLQELEQRLRNV